MCVCRNEATVFSYFLQSLSIDLYLIERDRVAHEHTVSALLPRSFEDR